MSAALLSLPLLLACSDKGADSGAVSAAAMPEVWGVDAAEDHDPAADVVEIHLTAALSTAELIEGEQTEVWAYNGQVPGPLIQARVGDTVRVVFENQLDEETTIHWHGLRIDDAMDGVPAVQDPVQPGETFTYEFVVPDAGSFWYHPHVRSYEQVERGLQGLLVVHEDDAPPVARDRYFALDDIYIRDGGGWYGFQLSHMVAMHGRMGNRLVVNGQPGPLEDSVEAGGTERWRLVNTANARTMYASVTGATWRVIAVDGNLLAEPYELERVELPVGRRVDVEVRPTGDAEAVGLQVELPGSSIGEWSEFPVFSGAVEGDGAAAAWLEWPAAPAPAVEEATQEIELVFDSGSQGGDLVWTINGEVHADHEDITVQGDTPTLVHLREASGAEHPFHLHGQFFQVVERNGQQLTRDSGLMDTVLMSGEDELTLYTTFDNPGRWMAHCHILEHAELGMMTELVVE